MTTKKNLLIAYQIQSVPTVYVLDAQGRVAAASRGFPRSWNRIRELNL